MLGLVRINQGRKLFLVHFKIVPFNAFWKASPLIVLVLVMFGLLIPMGWGAPRAMLWSYATLFDVEQRQAEVDELSGRFEAAQWNLDKTVVRAPADGYVINLALRKGARVGTLAFSPVMAFIETSNTIVGARSIGSMRATSSWDKTSKPPSSLRQGRSTPARSKACSRRARPARCKRWAPP